MAGKTEYPPATAKGRELIITRILDAPRDLVWKVWTEPQHIEKWWGPEGFTTRIEKYDFKPGGSFRYVMCGPDGKEYPGVGRFKEIDPPRRIVSTDDFGDDFPVGDFQKQDLPGEMVVTTTFEEHGGKTTVTLAILHASEADRQKHQDMGVVDGWHSSFDCLDDYLKTF